MKLVDKVNHDIGPGRGANTTLQDQREGRLSEIDSSTASWLKKAARGIATPRMKRSWRSPAGSTGELKPDRANLKIAMGY
jgi:2-dehydropantoate 2-reductase